MSDRNLALRALFGKPVELAVARMTFTGARHGNFLGFAPSGATVSWAGCALFTFRGERVASLWVLGDRNALEQQLRRNARRDGRGNEP